MIVKFYYKIGKIFYDKFMLPGIKRRTLILYPMQQTLQEGLLHN